MFYLSVCVLCLTLQSLCVIASIVQDSTFQ